MNKDRLTNFMKFNPYITLKFIIPAVLFYEMLDMFFKSFGFSISAVFLLFLLSAASAFWITNRKYLPIIQSVLFALGSVMFLLTIGEGALQQYFIVFASLLFMLAMLGLYRFFTPEEQRPQEEQRRFLDTGFNLNQSIALFSLFFLSSGIYGIYTTTNIPPWQMTLVIFAGTYLISYYLIQINFLKSQELELHLDYYKNRTFNFYAFLLALVMIELAWAMIFLPINPLTFGAIILAVFYAYWSIIRNYLRNRLTRSIFLSALAFSAFAVSIMLLTSKLYIN